MANKLYQIGEVSSVFGSEAGDDVVWSTENIADDAGRQSAFLDLGVMTNARAYRYGLRTYAQFEATPTIDEALTFHAKTSDGTHPDNDDGTGDAAVSTLDKLNNLSPVATIMIDEAAADIEMVKAVQLELWDRYFGLALWNTSGAATRNDTPFGHTKAILTPIPPELQ